MPSLVARSTATIEKTGLLTVVVMWDTGSSGSVQFDSTGRVWGGPSWVGEVWRLWAWEL